MASTFLPIAGLLLSSAFLLMAGGLHGLLLPVQGTIAGFTTVELGLIGTGWSVGFLAGCILMPAVVRRVGHVRPGLTRARASLSASVTRPRDRGARSRAVAARCSA